MISPESPGEDRHIKDKDRIKSTSPSRSRRRQESRGLSGRHRDSGTDDSAKHKAPELAEGYNYPHNSWKSEETKKRSKRNSPGRSDRAYSRRHTEGRGYSTSSGRSSDTDHSRQRVEAPRHSSSSGRLSYYSRSGARSRELEATVDQTRR